MITSTLKSPRQLAAFLNDHHERTCAGFYVTGLDRCMAARVRDGRLQVRPWFDEDRWQDLAGRQICDHNGRVIVEAGRE
jgi:hypothetical protein